MIIINRSRVSPAVARLFHPSHQQLKFKLRMERARLGDMNKLRNEVKACLAGHADVVHGKSIHCDAFKLLDKEVEMAVRVGGSLWRCTAMLDGK